MIILFLPAFTAGFCQSGWPQSAWPKRVLKAGANGYLLKNAEPEELTYAITHVARGEAIISPAMAAKLLGEFKSVTSSKAGRSAQADTSLSPREEEILRLVAEGASNKDIARFLAELNVNRGNYK